MINLEAACFITIFDSFIDLVSSPLMATMFEITKALPTGSMHDSIEPHLQHFSALQMADRHCVTSERS